ncbi:unnamed protein product [Symbiodinium necroappetens]|uniref:Uncharacterized protein n=1 Tax=Symbiodinium necroappetens TaxID=1628268 RepID=A0A812JW52_9DINO|nr:unnamed protein product [Symbiodinium necroappetens]
MILLALLAELCKTCQVYIHRWDNFKKGDVVSMAHASALLEDFKLQVNRLFAFRSPSNELQQPLVLAPEFTAGMLQVLRAGYDMLAGEVVVLDGRMLFFRPEWNEQSYREAVAAEIGAITNIVSNFVTSIEMHHNTAVAASFAPLDVKHWVASSRDDKTLSRPQVFGALAKVLGMEASALSNEYLVARASFTHLERPGDACSRSEQWGHP